MTVIAFDGRYVATDKMATNSGMPRSVTKLFKHAGKALAIMGDFGHGISLVAWFKSGCNPNLFPARHPDGNAFLAVFEKNKPVMVYENYPVPLVYSDTTYAGGCGRDFATTAMHCGKTAVEAVEIASIYDIHCGMGVDVIDLWEIASDQDDGRKDAPPRRASRASAV